MIDQQGQHRVLRTRRASDNAEWSRSAALYVLDTAREQIERDDFDAAGMWLRLALKHLLPHVRQHPVEGPRYRCLCSKAAVYVSSLDRMIHEDGTDNIACWGDCNRPIDAAPPEWLLHPIRRN